MPPRRNQWSGPSDAEIREAQAAVNIFFGLNRQAQIGVVVLLLVVGVFAAVAYFHSQHAIQTASLSSPQMLLGNPSAASSSFTDRDNYLMVKPYYALSYNSSTGCPNWVSWQVIEADLGTAPRKQVFDADVTLPAGMYAVTQHDYTGSGFDRGHMCPHSDRAANEEMSFATFVMSNIIPQAPNVNRKAWAQFEMYCRELVSREHDHLYITSGPDGRGGAGAKDFAIQSARDASSSPPNAGRSSWWCRNPAGPMIWRRSTPARASSRWRCPTTTIKSATDGPGFGLPSRQSRHAPASIFLTECPLPSRRR